jgi:hypothetical protein
VSIGQCLALVERAGDLRRVARAATGRAIADREWRQALVLARASGESYVDIAAMAGISDERVRQVVQEEAAKDPQLAARLPRAPLDKCLRKRLPNVPSEPQT